MVDSWHWHCPTIFRGRSKNFSRGGRGGGRNSVSQLRVRTRFVCRCPLCGLLNATFFCRISNVRKRSNLRACLFALFIARHNFRRIETSEPGSMKGADNPYSPTSFPGLFPSPGNEVAYCREKSTIISIRSFIKEMKLRFGIFYCEKKKKSKRLYQIVEGKITWCNNSDTTSEHNETVIDLAHCFCFYPEWSSSW